MTNVLYINFNWIMSPVINLCEGYINGGATIDFACDEINASTAARGILYDANKLKYIQKIIMYALATGAEFKTFNSWKEGSTYLTTKYKPSEHTEDVSLTYIDHFHHLGYTATDMAQLGKKAKTVGNWIQVLVEKGVFNELHWVKSMNSMVVFQDIREKLPNNLEEYFHTITEYEALHTDTVLRKFTEVVFCNSPEWVPSRYFHLFTMLVEAVDYGYNLPQKHEVLLMKKEG